MKIIASLSRNIITALDVGSSTVTTVVAERRKGEERPRILGIGIAPSFGVRRGAVVDLEDAISSIRASVHEARRSSGYHIKSAWLAVGGSHVSVASSRGVVAVSRADGEISHEDVRRAIAAAEAFIPKNANKEILHMIPRDFKVDHEAGIKDPVGMHGIRLEADVLIIECSIPFLKNLFKCVEAAGLRIDDYVFGPLAASEAALTKRQKELGVFLLDIGGGTASFMVFEEGVPIHAGVIPLGGKHITNDVAIGFRTHVDSAENIKVALGSCMPGEISKRDTVRIADFAPADIPEAVVSDDYAGVYTRRELAEIIEARLRDIFELVQKELKKINRTQLLPAGLVLTGGSSLVPGIVEFARREVKLPVDLGVPYVFEEAIDKKTAPVLVTCLGLLQWADKQQHEKGLPWLSRFTRKTERMWLRWVKSLLP
ncbi:MAG: cell division protein FtsA [Candidatus Sungbacteria bacterium RIFCSPHIGHO2_02_FULL_47_11]|uniref:Cell division protein FtsA n=1 Tax=Candidatus Sungbacteria bacterium RIFCSPHIGHO2_02_FULL_47_11 TaxID=1802270 RepID=A0A1G2KGN7_9BACT|nr:MAG: cell division protein FtsA [Candidatus Sungbacteria bacterium RIFCSPHIGHO2_02_FULL_47_11]